MFPTTPLKRTVECIGRGCMHCGKKKQFIVCLFVCFPLYPLRAVSGNLLATLLIVLAINFHGETKFSAENLSGKAVTHNHKKKFTSADIKGEKGLLQSKQLFCLLGPSFLPHSLLP